MAEEQRSPHEMLKENETRANELRKLAEIYERRAELERRELERNEDEREPGAKR
jgi:hypothetical protein